VDSVRDVLPFPTSDPYLAESANEVQDSVSQKNNHNFTTLEYGDPGNAVFYTDDDYAKYSRSWATTNDRTLRSEFYSALTGFGTTSGGKEPFDTVYDGGLIEHEAEFPIRILYNVKSRSKIADFN
jgi:hypothetical protein